MTPSFKISFIGAGRMCGAMASLLVQEGFDVIGIASKSIGSAESASKAAGGHIPSSDDIFMFVEDSDVLFITTNDTSIEDVALAVAENCSIQESQTFIHTSGSLPASILSPLSKSGATILSLHPLQSISSSEEGARNLRGSLFAIEGDERAYATAQKIVERIGGISHILDAKQKVLYHAAAVIACNYLVALADTSLSIFDKIGIEEEAGRKGLMRIIRGTVNNIDLFGPRKALTGPIVRGDLNTIRSHMDEIMKTVPEFAELYRTLAAYTIDIAVESGSLSIETAKSIRDELYR